ncbi:MAG: hypothetical protein IJ268_10455 [Proteobacteria bacterium]|nr:hypothetical protein [Pseudomonadota bacterium]
MKKIIFCLISLGFAGLLLSGCVNDNQYIVLKGLVPGPLSECDATNESQTYLYAVGPCAWKKDAEMLLSAQVMNFVTGEVPWSSSGGGSGTTFEGELVNPGTIYLDNITIECKSVDGEPSACDGSEPVKISSNFPIKGSGGGICINFDLNSILDLSQWVGQRVIFDIYGNYHDASRISGTTSHLDFTVDLTGDEGKECVTFVDENAEKEKEEEPAVVPDDPNAGKEEADESGGEDGI